MRLHVTSSAIGIGFMAAMSRADCAPWELGTSLWQNASAIGQRRAGFSPGSAHRKHQFTRDTWWTSPSLRPGISFRYTHQDGQHETEQPNHSASLGDSITSSTRVRFSVHTGILDVVAILLRGSLIALDHLFKDTRRRYAREIGAARCRRKRQGKSNK